MNTALTYLFDPLCGWCYGAAPALTALSQQPGLTLTLAPAGLFAGAGGRPLNADFARFAWANDQRIAQLTGQPFSEAYRTQVLGQATGRFDSSAATLALSAVALTTPTQELATLQALQQARYGRGLDTSSAAVVTQVLGELDLANAAVLLATDDARLRHFNAERLQQAQQLMQGLGLQGVPALVVSSGQTQRVLRGELLYGKPAALLQAITGH
jgi:putative protein-disulfide isomerase